jgi:hypothetical protein
MLGVVISALDDRDLPARGALVARVVEADPSGARLRRCPSSFVFGPRSSVHRRRSPFEGRSRCPVRRAGASAGGRRLASMVVQGDFRGSFQSSFQGSCESSSESSFQSSFQSSSESSFQSSFQNSSESSFQNSSESSFQNSSESSFQNSSESSFQNSSESSFQSSSESSFQSSFQGSFQSSFQGSFQSSFQGSFQSSFQGSFQSSFQGSFQSSFRGSFQSSFQGSFQSSFQGSLGDSSPCAPLQHAPGWGGWSFLRSRRVQKSDFRRQNSDSGDGTTGRSHGRRRFSRHFQGGYAYIYMRARR